MVTQELLNYIQAELVAGMGADDITAKLVTSGWSGSDIELAFSKLGIETTNNILRITSQVINKYHLIIVIIGMVIGISVIGFITLLHRQYLTNVNKNSVSTTKHNTNRQTGDANIDIKTNLQNIFQ